MSQVNEQQVETNVQENSVQSNEQEFDAGFNLNDTEENKENNNQTDTSVEKQEQKKEQPETQATETEETQSDVQATVAPEQTESATPQATNVQQQTQVAQQPAQAQPKTIEIPDSIQAEWDKLKQINPEAAELAKEDSEEGARIRERLSEYGADIAFDRAEAVIKQRRTEEQNKVMQAVEEHNAQFKSVLQRDHPEYVALMLDTNRKPEAENLIKDIFAWINTKPYAEGARLMPIAQYGRNPHEVSALLTQYKKERANKTSSTKKSTPDPTGALAVPSRGAPNTPTGIGDKDSFDAGWNLNQSITKE